MIAQDADTTPIDRQADVLLEAGWLLVAILVPLAVNLWANQPFEPPKAALLRSLVWAMAGLWLVDCLLRRRAPWRELDGNPLRWPVLALVAVLTLASVVAVDRRLSLWGSYERSQGALTLLSYALLFAVVSARLQRQDQARRLMAAMAATGVPLVGLALAQALGWDPVDLISDARSPIYATLGRSNFLGAYLAMLLPLTVALLVTARRKWMRAACGALVLGELLVVGLTLARGAWLAAAVGLAAWGLLWLRPRLAARWQPPTVGWRTFVAVAIVLGLALLVVGLAGMLLLGGQGGSTAARLTIWRATVALIAERPALGYGPDALGLIFPGVYPPQLVYYQGRGLGVDRAHNLFLDWAVTAGLPGLLAGSILLAAFFAAGWRSLWRATDPERRALLAACLAAVAANRAGNLASFDVTATATATWLLLALLPALGGGRQRQRTERLADNRPPAPACSPVKGGNKLPLAGLLLAGVVLAVIQFNARPVAADVAARTAERRAGRGDWQGAIAAGRQAVALWPDEPAHRLSLSWAYLQQAQAAGGDPLPWLQRAEAELLAARDLRPGDFNTWAALGELYGLWGNRWDAAKLAPAHDAYRQATELAPNQATLHVQWGMVELAGGRFTQAAARFRQAVDLDATDGYAFSHLGDAEMAQGRVAEALAAYRQAVRWAPELSYGHVGLARCYWLLGFRQAAVAALDQALRLEPDNEAAWALRQEMSAGP